MRIASPARVSGPPADLGRGTSVRFSCAVLTWLLGGLNFQIEHHLFPRVPHTHYPQIARIVRRTAENHGVRYTVQPSFWAAIRSQARHLRSMGPQGVAVELEMG